MNVCIKCGRCPLALETYHKMRQEGCAANVVTYNTLIDVYGKMGQWEQANKIPSIMKGEVSSPFYLLRIQAGVCQPLLILAQTLGGTQGLVPGRSSTGLLQQVWWQSMSAVS